MGKPNLSFLYETDTSIRDQNEIIQREFSLLNTVRLVLTLPAHPTACAEPTHLPFQAQIASLLGSLLETVLGWFAAFDLWSAIGPAGRCGF